MSTATSASTRSCFSTSKTRISLSYKNKLTLKTRPCQSKKNLFAKTPSPSNAAALYLRLSEPEGAQTSERLSAAVLVRETPLPRAVGQRQQQEEDPAHNQDRPGAADARHRPGEVVGKRHGVLAGKQGQHGLVEDQQGQQHQDPCSGDRRARRHAPTPAGAGRRGLHSPDRMKQMEAGLRKKRISLLSDMVMQMAPITIRKRLNMANMAVATFRSAGEARGGRESWVTVICPV